MKCSLANDQPVGTAPEVILCAQWSWALFAQRFERCKQAQMCGACSLFMFRRKVDGVVVCWCWEGLA